MKKAKIIVILVVSVLVLIVSLQNTQAVETKLLFATISMPRVLLLTLTFVGGFIVGLIAATQILGSSRKSKAQTKQ
jgi:uncharacterized integral membrane protein